MDRLDKIASLLQQAQGLENELQAEIAALREDDLFAETRRLQGEVLVSAQQRTQLSAQNAQLIEENRRLQNALYEQLFSERSKIISMTQDKVNAYFADTLPGEPNRLTQLEQDLRVQIAQTASRIEQSRVGLESGLYARLRDFERETDAALAAARSETDHDVQTVWANQESAFTAAQAEPLTEQQMLKRGRQNNVESFFGLKLFNVLGIFLIIIGVIAGARFTYTYLPDVMKGVLIYALGIMMLVGGELYNRKKGANVFSLGMTAGGIAVIHAGTALSFFALHILPQTAALAVCVATTAIAFFLSLRRNSQLISVFALIGGFLPLFSAVNDRTMLYFSMAYFIILSLFALSLAYVRKWAVTQFFSFGLNVIAALAVIFSLNSLPPSASNGPVAACYVFFVFIIHSFIPIISSLRNKRPLLPQDVVLLCVNTVVSALILFSTLQMFDLWDYAGLAAVILAVFYLVLAIFLERRLDREKPVRALFYITGIAFAALAIPIQFDSSYLSQGWLVEGVLLAVYGILSGRRLFKIAGHVLFGLCFFTFIFYDLLVYEPQFFIKFLFVTLGFALLSFAYIWRRQADRGLGNSIVCAAAADLWCFLVYAVLYKLSPLLSDLAGDPVIPQYVSAAFVILLSFGIGCALTHVGWFSRLRLRGLAGVMQGSAILLLFVQNANPFFLVRGSAGAMAAGISCLLACNLFAVFVMRDSAKPFFAQRKAGSEWYPLVLSGYFVVLLLQNIVTLFDLSANSLWISLIFALTATGWVLFGFVRRLRMVRIFGLALSFLSVIKFFIIDLAFLTEGLRIVSYFAMGITLLAISFIYQHFNKKLVENAAHA